MAITTFAGPVRSLGGFVESGFNNAIDATAALTGGTLTLTALPVAASAPGILPATVGSPGHAGKELTVSADGGTFTLPLIFLTFTLKGKNIFDSPKNMCSPLNAATITGLVLTTLYMIIYGLFVGPTFIFNSINDLFYWII